MTSITHASEFAHLPFRVTTAPSAPPAKAETTNTSMAFRDRTARLWRYQEAATFCAMLVVAAGAIFWGR
jgi:hypothetical protein